jgi:hypothetical protein
MGDEGEGAQDGGAGRDGWLTLAEAAALLGRSLDTLRMQRRLHALHAEKRAGVWMTRPAWVEAYRHAHLGRKGWAARLDGRDDQDDDDGQDATGRAGR